MSVRSIPTQGTTIGTLVSQAVEPGILISLSAFLLPPADSQFFVFLDIGIMSDRLNNSGRTMQLASGYLRQQQGLSWNGIILLQPQDRIFMMIRGITASPIELVERRVTRNSQIIPGVTLSDLLKNNIAGLS